MTGWAGLEAALDASAAQGEPIRFWWRDDDAGRATPALDRLLDLAERQDAPLALAVVGAWLEADAAASIVASSRAAILQHGIAHRNAAPEGAKPVELDHQPPDHLVAALGRGRKVLEEAFGALFLAVLVPPWNRIAPALVARLPGAGYRGLSTFGRRASPEPAPGLRQINTHLDPVDWRGGRGFTGTEASLGQLLDAIDGADEPVGVLSHHLVMDEPGWAFLERLLEVLRGHPGARLAAAPDLFGEVA
ncbi:MAG TPA: polysaccharide deacetylase family protein [Geminicoccaceae bacterium]